MSEKPYIYASAEEEHKFDRTKLNKIEAHKKAEDILDEYEIKPERDFAGLYGDAVVKKDNAEVKRLEGLFQINDSLILADILETIVCQHGELSNWFGSKSQVIKTTRWDDYKNKIDMVVETEMDDKQFSHLALGIDVTFGKDLTSKFESIKGKIQSGALGELKYFHSDRQHFTGRKRKIPLVVIALEMPQVEDLALLWMNRRNAELAVHPIQVTILEEALLQLETFSKFAKSIGRDELVPILDLESQKINEMLAQKKDAGLKGLKNDKVFEEIKRNLQHFAVSDVVEK